MKTKLNTTLTILAVALAVIAIPNAVYAGGTRAGTSVDNTATSEGTCIEATVLQGLTTYLPAGTYTLTVTGFEPASSACWDATFPDLEVGLGPNAPFDLVVPQTDATGTCAP